MTKKLLLFASAFILGTGMFGQVSVKIAPKIKRYLGDESDLDRKKYFNFHSTSNDAEASAFRAEYGVVYGRGFWAPFSDGANRTGTVGVYPNYTPGTNNSAVRTARPVVATEHPGNVYRWDVSKEDAAKWAVEYYLDVSNSVPEFFEPMNEPFVHSDEDQFHGTGSTDQLVREGMADWFGAIGQEVHNTPQLANMKVVGYSSAWPSVELWDFGHWDTRMKMFMDRAGEHMDAFATHLYDGINVTGADSKRSGSNSEAILDLIETYSYAKWGIVKPHAITEYGGIEKGYGDDYSDIRSVQTIRSINHILINLLERQNNMALSIPFIGDKALWHITAANNYQPYGSVLWRPKVLGVPVTANTEWVLTPRIHFFDLWKEVKGNRVYYRTTNPDIQTQAFVDQNKLYVILSNLDEQNKDVTVKLFEGNTDLQSVRIKRLKIYSNSAPVYTDQTQSDADDPFTLIPGETVVLEYTYGSNLEFTNSIMSKKYYTTQHLETINGSKTFNFNGVETGISGGFAKLRMSIGRKHNKSKKPIITLNGNSIAMPVNWAGGDQSSRDDFFGMIQVPVPFEYLQENNEVTVLFPDSEGRISSMILQVEMLKNLSYVGIGKGKEYEIDVYPTLVDNGWLKIKLKQTGVFNTAELYSLSGLVVKRKNIVLEQSELIINDMDNLSRGVYILKLSGANGDLYTHKLMVN